MAKCFGRKQSRVEPNGAGVHVAFRDHKRIVPFNQDDQVDVLRHQFLRVFSDVLGDRVAPAEVMFQRYHNGFEDFVDISDAGELEKGDKFIKAIVRHKEEASGVKCPGYAHVPICYGGVESFLVRRILPSVDYCMWSNVSRGLIKRDPNTNVVSCDGKSVDENTVVKSQVVIKRYNAHLYGFIFTDAGGDRYAMKVTDEGPNEITVEPISKNGDLGINCIFEPDYYWGKTMFKSFASNKYLGCDVNGNAMLVDIGSTINPNYQALFQVSKVNPK